MEAEIPRVLLAGTGSGCGKTTAACAIVRALARRKHPVGVCKCGPDYIDPMFLSRAVRKPCGNLDPFFFTPNTLNAILAKHAEGNELCVIEGVMGYYDGLGLTDEASTFTVAKMTGSPVVLIVNGKGGALSLLAILHGFADFRADSGIQGVLFNHCSRGLYPMLAEAVRREWGGRVRPLGFFPPLPECGLKSRHLGLVLPEEVPGWDRVAKRLADTAEECVDLEGLVELARTAPPVLFAPPDVPAFSESVRIAVARDRAFCFYYTDSLRLLEDMGAELAPFSPLRDAALPENVHGLYLGGGYPELCAEELSGNAEMRRAVRRAVLGGLPCVAECGGFMYLTERIGNHEMAGVLPGACFNTGRLSRFGYVRLTAKRDSLLCRAGETIPAHEFHHWDCEEPGCGFRAEKPSGQRWDCAVTTERLYAGFPHFHFAACPQAAERFYQACLEEKRHDAGIRASR